jgi:hypothetical protein
VSAFTIGMGYLLGGIIPLLPYFFIPKAHITLMYSSLFIGIVLLVFGAVKARFTDAAGKGAGGYVWGALSTLPVGGAAAAAACGIVAMLEASDLVLLISVLGRYITVRIFIFVYSVPRIDGTTIMIILRCKDSVTTVSACLVSGRSPQCFKNI